MCGIFGFVGPGQVPWTEIRTLAKLAQRRGSDASGLFYWAPDGYVAVRSERSIGDLARNAAPLAQQFLMGHSRLATNGERDNQPICIDGVAVIHNGIVVNDVEIWNVLGQQPKLESDTEVIAALVGSTLGAGGDAEQAVKRVMNECRGSVSAAICLPQLGTLCLVTNTGSLFSGVKGVNTFFASERFSLMSIGCDQIKQLLDPLYIQIPKTLNQPMISEARGRPRARLPKLGSTASEEALLEYLDYDLSRCSNCVLPETMPFITFDAKGVCNYCHAYVPRNNARPIDELLETLERYRRGGETDCIVPFSGGRDSSYGLHLITRELGMRPVTYTYDWGMITDLGRRNISLMSSALGVENIVVADDIVKKRRNISRNLVAWLDSPHLGLLSLLTAGDKHFYRHIEPIKAELGVSLNLWSVNPLEVTHFKAGFLGIPPDFEERNVYQHGWQKQVGYHAKRFRAMSGSRKYFNRSLWDTLSGEYFRSIRKKADYLHLFDYRKWDESEIEATLDSYGWERASDTRSSWRIGDATAAFYNYIYYTVAGFTEHDTFRSNQVREGDLDRQTALNLVREENRPRYPNIKWYLEALGGFDYAAVIRRINAIPKAWESDLALSG